MLITDSRGDPLDRQRRTLDNHTFITRALDGAFGGTAQTAANDAVTAVLSHGFFGSAAEDERIADAIIQLASQDEREDS